MNSFILTSETSHKSEKYQITRGVDWIRLGLLGGVMAAVLGAVATLNFQKDPYGARGGKPAMVSRFSAKANAPLGTLFEIERGSAESFDQAEVALVGDSRARQLAPARFSTMDGKPLINFACGGSTLEEALTLISFFEDRLPRVKLLVICTPLERFTEEVKVNRTAEAKPLATSMLRYLLNWRIAQDSWTLATTPFQSAIDQDTTPQPVKDVVVGRAWRLLYQANTAAAVHLRLQALRQTVAPFSKRGVQIMLYRPPLQQTIQDLIKELHVQKTWDELLPELQKLGQVVDFTNLQEIDGHPLTFSDPVHTKEDAPALLQRLLESAGSR